MNKHLWLSQCMKFYTSIKLIILAYFHGEKKEIRGNTCAKKILTLSME